MSKTKTRIQHLLSLAHFTKIHNAHAGKAGVVIGNGPSLNFEDLERLSKAENLVTIASNKIYMAFDHTSWRPDYYTVVDKVLAPKIVEDVSREIGTVYTPNGLAQVFKGSKVYCWRNAAVDFSTRPSAEFFTPDIRKPVYGGCTVTVENIQLAVHLGLDPIYIIGCDHYYGGEDKIEKDGKTEVKADQSNHFIKNYRQPGEVVNSAPIDDMNFCYQSVALWAEKNKKSIYNATRGGHLEFFPRCDFDSIKF